MPSSPPAASTRWWQLMGSVDPVPRLQGHDELQQTFNLHGAPNFSTRTSRDDGDVDSFDNKQVRFVDGHAADADAGAPRPRAGGIRRSNACDATASAPSPREHGAHHASGRGQLSPQPEREPVVSFFSECTIKKGKALCLAARCDQIASSQDTFRRVMRVVTESRK